MNLQQVTKEGIEYIEQCLEEKVNLEEVSRYLNYSKFHFHRMFLHEMGLSVTDYIRKRRVIYSAHKLIVSNVSVTELGLSVGFNNVDTFIRNFKAYYGVSPQQFRERKKADKRYHKEGDEMMRHEHIMLRECQEDEKQNAVIVIDRMIDLSTVAHRDGLLALESEMSSEDSPFLRKAIELLLKGTEYEKLDSILTNVLIYSQLNDDEKLKRLIMLKGTLLLHEGTYPWDMRIELSSYLGETFIDTLDEKYDNTDKLEVLFDEKYMEVDNAKLKKELDQMKQRTLQRVFRECDIIIITLMLIGMDKPHRDMVINSLPQSRKKILADVLISFDAVNVHSIVDASKAVVEVIQSLRLSNEIK